MAPARATAAKRHVQAEGIKAPMTKRLMIRVLLLAPPATVLAIYFSIGVFGFMVRSSVFLAEVAHKHHAAELPVIFVMSIGSAYLAALTAGIPSMFVLSRHNMLNPSHFLLAGLIGGVILGSIGGLITLLADHTNYRCTSAAAVAVSCCAVCVTLLSMVWVIIRPGRNSTG